MSAAFVGECASFPESVPGVFPLEVLSDDGELARMYGPLSAEVTLRGPRQEDRSTLVVSTSFPTLERAERAGKILADAFAEVRTILAEGAPFTCALPHHRWHIARFSRSTGHVAVCKRCGEVADLMARSTA